MFVNFPHCNLHHIPHLIEHMFYEKFHDPIIDLDNQFFILLSNIDFMGNHIATEFWRGRGYVFLYR